MSNTAGVCWSFKTEMMLGYHCFGGGIRTTDTIKGALYLTSATMSPQSTVYTTSGEVSGTGYTAGGATIGNPTAPAISGTSAIWTPSNYGPVAVTIAGPFDTLFLYNSSQGQRGICVLTFPAQSSVTSFTFSMPASGGLLAIT